MCFTNESALSGYKYRSGIAASMVLVVVAVIVIVVAVVGAETSWECMLPMWSDFDHRTVSTQASERKVGLVETYIQ